MSEEFYIQPRKEPEFLHTHELNLISEHLEQSGPQVFTRKGDERGQENYTSLPERAVSSVFLTYCNRPESRCLESGEKRQLINKQQHKTWTRSPGLPGLTGKTNTCELKAVGPPEGRWSGRFSRVRWAVPTVLRVPLISPHTENVKVMACRWYEVMVVCVLSLQVTGRYSLCTVKGYLAT